MAACRACLTPRPRVPPARPDSSAAGCSLVLWGGWGFAPRSASRSRMPGQSAWPDFPAFSSFISPAAISPAISPAALNSQCLAPPGEDEGVF